MRTTEQYLERLKGMSPNVYLGGKLLPRDDERFLPGIRANVLILNNTPLPVFKASHYPARSFFL